MRIVLVLKPYAVEVYSKEGDTHTLVGIEEGTRIETESVEEYEKRMIFICKGLCTDMRASPFFKAIAKKVEGIDVVLCAPWCVYEVLQVEKDFGKQVKIEKSQLDAMKVSKQDESLHLVESYISNILLNGYSVESIKDQIAQIVQFQYVHIYARASFVVPLIKMMESVFHTHAVACLSVYGLTEQIALSSKDTCPDEMRIILEEESIDIAYIAKGVHVVHTFVPDSYMQLEDMIASKLSADHVVVERLLQSRYESNLTTATTPPGIPQQITDKNAKKLWPDLDPATKHIVDMCISEHAEKVLSSIRNSIDCVSAEYTKDFISVRIYCVSKRIAAAYGNEVALRIHSDPYVSMKIHVTAETTRVIEIF
jgi:hypothetical protein